MLQRREKKVNTMKTGTDGEEIKKIRNSFRTLNLQIKESATPTMMKAQRGENHYISSKINKTGPATEILTDQL